MKLDISSGCYNISETILIAIILFVLSVRIVAQSDQNKRRIGSFTRCEIESKTLNIVPAQYPPWLKYPKDTVITSGAKLKIPIFAEFPGALFTGELEIDFPGKTSAGTWTKLPYPSRILLDSMLNIRARVHGSITFSSDGSSGTSNYRYEVSAYTASSTLEAPCPGRYRTEKHDTLSPGSYAVDVEASCSFSLFEIPGPNYEYEPMTKYFTAGYRFGFSKWGGFDVNFTTNIKVYYSFDRITGPLIGLSSTYMEFFAEPKGNPLTKKLTLSNAGSGQLDYSISVSTADSSNWLAVSSLGGSLQQMQSTELDVTVNPALLKAGEYNGQISVSAPNTANSPALIKIRLKLSENKLSFKFDPPKIKCGEWTALEISVVDANGNLMADYSGGAEVRLLKNLSTDGITKLPEYQSILITNGRAQPVFVFTPKEPFSADSTITNRTVLSGDISIEVKPESPSIRADTAEIAVYSPIDFYIDHIEIQQGVKDIDKDVTLEYKPGENRTFSARNFIAGHETIIRTFVGYRKTVDIPFSHMDYKLRGSLLITHNSITTGPYKMGEPGLSENPADVAVKDTFLVEERIHLKDALFRLLHSDICASNGSYEFCAELDLENLKQGEDDLKNNIKYYDAFFTVTKPFRVFAFSGKMQNEGIPKVSSEIFLYTSNAYPLGRTNLLFTDPNIYINSYVNDETMFSFNYWNSLLYSLNRQNELAAPGKQYDCILLLATDELMNKFSPGAPGSSNRINGKASVIQLSHDNAPQSISHELGHILGLKETYNVSLEYKNPFAEYLYTGDPNPIRSNANDAGNWIESGNIYFPDLKQAFGPNNYHDIMSGLDYNVQHWMDRVTWDYLYRKFVLSLQKRANVNNAPAADGYIAVSGSISESDSVILNPLIRMTQVPVLDDTLDGNYSVEFCSSDGRTLASYYFDVVFLMPGVRETSVVPFCLYLPFPKSAGKMVIKKYIPDTEAKVLMQKVFTDNAPAVQIISPRRGDVLTDNVKIKWSAFDQDNDDLTYDICYSPDVAREIVIATNLTDTSFTWNAAAYERCSDGAITVIANDGINDGRATVSSLTDVKTINTDEKIVKGFVLEQNYPNPFNSSTIIEYALPYPVHAKLEIYDLLGQCIKTLVDSHHQSGYYRTTWDGKDARNNIVASGIYFCKMETKEYNNIIKIAFAK